jgi:hypothetical protein
MVGDVEHDACRLARDTGIARRAIDAFDERARSDLLRQRMLAPARADEKDVHAPPLGVARRVEFAAWSGCLLVTLG